MDALEITTSVLGRCTVVALHGDLDVATMHLLDHLLTDTPFSPEIGVVIDMSKLTFVDSSGLSVILRHYKRAKDEGMRFNLAGPQYRSAKALWVTGLYSRLPIFDTVDEAVAQCA